MEWLSVPFNFQQTNIPKFCAYPKLLCYSKRTWIQMLLNIFEYIQFVIQYCETMGKLHNRPALQKRWAKATLSLRIVDLVKGGGTSPVAPVMAAGRHGMTLQLHILEDLFFIHFFGRHPKKWIPWRHLSGLFEEHLANFENGFRVSSCKTCNKKMTQNASISTKKAVALVRGSQVL